MAAWTVPHSLLSFCSHSRPLTHSQKEDNAFCTCLMTSLCAPFPTPMRLLKPNFHLISGMMSELFSMRTVSLLASPRQVSLAKAGGLEHLHCCGIFLCCTLLCYSSAFKIMVWSDFQSVKFLHRLAESSDFKTNLLCPTLCCSLHAWGSML